MEDTSVQSPNPVPGWGTRASIAKTRPFARRLKGIFFFLIAIVAISILSPLLLLHRLIDEEQVQVTSQAQWIHDELRREWLAHGDSVSLKSNLLTVVQRYHCERLSIGIYDQQTSRWTVYAYDADLQSSPLTTSTQSHPLPVKGTSEWVGGTYRVTRTVATEWKQKPTIVSATLNAPRLGQLQQQLRIERWLRTAALLGVLLFTVMFYRSVLVPFQDMRRRARALVTTGILPPQPDGDEHDAEYVMASFDTLVAHLVARSEEFQKRAVRSERHARTVEQFNEYILSSLSTGVIIINREGEILRFNRAAEEILHLSAAEVTGFRLTDTRLPAELIALCSAGLARHDIFVRHELRVTLASGEMRFLGTNTSLVRDEDGEFVGLSALLTDLTAIKKLENEMDERRRLADLGEMAAGLAHQLRNSIAAILGYGKMLRRMIDDSTKASEWTEAIVKETEETSDMVTRFLDFARPLDSEVQRFVVEESIARAVESVKPILEERQCHVTIKSSETGDPVTMTGDEVLLRQVFASIIQNAAEAIESDCRISVSIESVTSTPDCGGSLVRISDNGPGIPETVQDNIFQPFFTTRDYGIGLGLALAKKIVAVHDGSLSIAETGPDGTTFEIFIPDREVTKPYRPESSPAMSSNSLGRRKRPISTG